jgi:hypothetical protein
MLVFITFDRKLIKHTIGLTLPLFIEIHVLSLESEQSCICALGLLIFASPKSILRLDV